MMLLIEFDGACEPINPGGVATCGWCGFLVDLHHEELPLFSGSNTVFHGGALATNNAAEWCALGFALKEAFEGGHFRKVQELRIRGDSQLVIKQLTGEWQCRHERMQRYRDRCMQLLNAIGLPWQAKWISRAENGRADALSREAYTKTTGKPFPERQRR